SEQTFTAFGPGTYWVEAVDSCSGVQLDTISILVEPATQVELPSDIVVCPGSELTFSLTGFASYQWFPSAAVDCQDCPVIHATIDSSTAIIVVAGTALGCYSIDTVHIELIPPFSTVDTIAFCKGDTVSVFGQSITSPGDYQMAFVTENGCDSIHTITLVEVVPLDISLSPTNTSCYGEADGMLFIENDDPAFQFSLDGISYQPNPLFTSLPAGEYQLNIRHSVGCEEIVSFHIGQPPKLALSLPQDTSIRLGDSLFLLAQTFPTDSLLLNWSPAEGLSCTDCLQPVASPLETTLYSLIVENTSGCIVEDEMEVRVRFDKQVYIPNAFSPNGDGRNDLFYLFGGPDVAIILRLRVFDRWGELVYKEQNLPPNQPAGAWDGTFRGQRLNPGMFIYIAEVEFINRQVEVFKGEVNLVR
ncbi:MAG: gliding motility-associated C-terminal domain-containing protein, partial [Phaeodactylibacter sp.]|nr:gliding motility-associated C-terminal domain-containing protein [Phaeodactylibacter sp.]